MSQSSGTPASSVQPSPFRNLSSSPFRPELGRGSHYTPSRLNAPGTPQSESHAESEQSTTSETLIWGTNVNTQDVIELIISFLRNYKAENNNASENDEGYYVKKIKELAIMHKYNLNIDCSDFLNYEPTKRFYSQLVNYPQDIVILMDVAVNQLYNEIMSNSDLLQSTTTSDNQQQQQGTLSPTFQVRPFHLKKCHKMRELDPVDIDTLVSIKGMIIRCSSIIPDLTTGYFRCVNCKQSKEEAIDRGRINEPIECEHCKAKHSFELIHNRCVFSNKQFVKMQEDPELIPDGETPQTIILYTFDDLIDVAKPGDRVEITGILRAVPTRVNPRQRTVRSIYRTYIDVLHIQKIDKGRMSNEDSNEIDADSEYFTTFDETNETLSLKDQEIRQFNEMAKSPTIYDDLVKSFAPSIWEMEDVKKGLLCMMLGGSTLKPTHQKSLPSLRGEINILLCGDPGLSKSQLLKYVHDISSRGIYTSGKGSSAVGLTAYITKDPDTNELVLESGALVLSDRGICCIDEFDKMSDSARSTLHEVMEQQTISIAKAGIICTLNARTSILAAANPINSRYDPKLSVVQNLQLPPSLLSRFDLIYLLLDKPSSENDEKLANHLVSLYYPSEIRENSNRNSVPYSQETLTKFISYARKNIHPKLTEESVKILSENYVKMRNGSNSLGKGKTITATPRQLESLIRISEALAKMRFSENVDPQDVLEAVRLLNVSTQKSATDNVTGVIDMDGITTNYNTRERQEIINEENELDD